MSRVSGNTFIIETEPEGTCELCGKTAELRPYGPGGKNICFSCGMKNREITDMMFDERIKNVEKVVYDENGMLSD